VTSVYIIDDEPLVREVVSELVQDLGCPNRPFASGTAFLEALPDLDPGCMLVDLCMEDLSGIDLIRATAPVRQSFPAVLMSGHATIENAVRAIKAGAIEILQKPIDTKRLRDALALADQALEAIPPQSLEDCVPVVADRYRLTGRQTDVLHALVAGKSNKQIAAQLSISSRTVEMHRAAVMAKLGVRSLPELLRVLVAATVRPDAAQSPPPRRRF